MYFYKFFIRSEYLVTHINVIKWVDYVLGIVLVITGLLCGIGFFLGASLFGFSDVEGSGWLAFIFGSLGLVFAIVFLIFGILNILAGSALANKKGWARWYNIICVGLPNIGALWGIYVIWALFFNEEVKTLFDNRY